MRELSVRALTWARTFQLLVLRGFLASLKARARAVPRPFVLFEAARPAPNARSKLMYSLVNNRRC